MASPVTVIYGGYTFDVTPYVSRSQEVLYNSTKHGQSTRITLNGTLLGDTFSDIETSRNSLINAFSTDFQKLTVLDGGVGIFTGQSCIVQSVNFSPANAGAVDYTIDLECYQSGLFSGSYGVIEESNDHAFSLGDNGIVTIAHNVSAKGIPTGAGGREGIKNAIDFVNNLTGYDPTTIAPKFIETGALTANNLVLLSLEKNIDRVASTYSVSEQWAYQPTGYYNAPIVSGYLSQIDTSISSGVSADSNTVNVSYTLQGSKYSSASTVRNNFKSSVTTGTLYEIATGVSNDENLYPIPSTFSVEDSAEADKKVIAKLGFETNGYFADGERVYFDHKFSIDHDDIQDITNVQVDGEIIAKGNKSYRYELVSGYLNDIRNSSKNITGFLYSAAYSGYSGVIDGEWQLNPTPLSYSVTENKFKGTIGLSASFSSRDFISGFSESSFSLNGRPALKQYSATPSVNKNGLYAFVDLGYKTREEMDLSYNFTALQDYGFSPNWSGVAVAKAKFLNVYATGSLSRVGMSDQLVTKENISISPVPFLNLSANYGFNCKAQSPFNF